MFFPGDDPKANKEKVNAARRFFEQKYGETCQAFFVREAAQLRGPTLVRMNSLLSGALKTIVNLFH